YEFSPAAAYRTVERPVVVQREQVDHLVLRIAAALGFFAADALAGVLDHFAARGNVLTCGDTPAVDLRAPDNQLETGVFRVDGRLVFPKHGLRGLLLYSR